MDRFREFIGWLCTLAFLGMIALAGYGLYLLTQPCNRVSFGNLSMCF